MMTINSLSLTHCYLSMQLWALNTATLLSAIRLLCFGKHNLVTSQMAHNRLLMNLSQVHFKSGVSDPLSSCSCHMVMKAKDQTTLRLVLSDTLPYVPNKT